MAQNKQLTFGPVALTTTLTTNVLNPPTLTGGVGGVAGNCYFLLKHARITNKTGSAATFSFWLGATGGNVAGTEVIGQAVSVPANSYVDWNGYMTIDTTQFLVGGSGTATALTFEAEGEVGIR